LGCLAGLGAGDANINLKTISGKAHQIGFFDDAAGQGIVGRFCRRCVLCLARRQAQQRDENSE
ncbi:hypothetical protein, partial [Propionivibrio sp.]|uniref:hypothetical protein n=1 Tax=Propionivibrio sp. TaxID=2212460 RepID=UPI00260EB510